MKPRPEISAETTIFEGSRFSLVRMTESSESGDVRSREVVRHPGAAVILAVLDDGQIVLVEQYRPALGRTLLEVPAGTVEPGESSLDTARRELQEETGYQARSWTGLTGFHPAPGLTDERMDVFLARELVAGEPSPDPGERLEVRTMPLEELRGRLLAGEIEDGKTLVALLYVMFLGVEAESRAGEAPS